MAKTYTINRDYSGHYRNLLAEADFPVTQNGNGQLILNKTQLKLFLKLTGAFLNYYSTSTRGDNAFDCAIVTKRSATISETVAKIIKPVIAVPSQAIKVINWSGSARSKYVSITSRILSPVVKRNIILSVPHGSPIEMSPRGAFQVYVWSHPTLGVERKGISTPETLFGGHKVGYRPSPFVPSTSPEGVILYDGDYAVGELCFNALYIYHDAVETGHVGEQCVYASILKLAAEVYAKTDWGDIETIQAELEKKRKEAAKLEVERVIKAQEDRVKTFAKEAISRSVSRNARTIKALKKSVTAQENVLFTARRDLCAAEKGTASEETEKQFLDEFRKLSEGYAGCIKAEFHRNVLTATIGKVHATNRYNGCVHLLGDVEIIINFGDSPYIKMKDVKKRKRIPHTDGRDGGNVCLGNAQQEMFSYMANFEMLAAVGFMVSFLENGIDTTDVWGRVLRNFPTVG